MVQYGAWTSVFRRESALCGSAEFAVLRGDVVESGEAYVEAKFFQRLNQPDVAKPV